MVEEEVIFPVESGIDLRKGLSVRLGHGVSGLIVAASDHLLGVAERGVGNRRAA